MSGRYSATITMRRPDAIDRLWYRRLHVDPPLQTGSTGPRHARWTRLMPYRWRRLHRAYANAFGFFWTTCPLCDRPFGGHEYGSDIPDPTRPPNGGMGICSRCTRARATR